MTAHIETITDEQIDYYITLIPGYDPHRDNHGEFFLDYERARDVLQFSGAFCTHTKGRLAGQPYVMDPHERAIVCNLFGWQRKSDGTRRYRDVFYFVARGNSKTTLAAVIVLYVSLMDGEAGAENYSTATKRDQAGKVREIITQMIKNNAHLADKFTVTESGPRRILWDDGASYYEALSAEASGAHSLNIHLVINDEIHAHTSRKFLDAIDTGLGKRAQPINFDITTSDFNRPESLCNEKYDQAVAVRDGADCDPYLLPVIYEANPKRMVDDPTYWETEEAWYEANPMLGKAVSLEYMQRQFKKAKRSPAFRLEFMRLHENFRTESESLLLNMDAWIGPCGGKLNLDDYKGRSPVGVGLDLGNTSDLTALCVLYEYIKPDDEPGVEYAAFWWHWCPETKALEREQKGKGFILTAWREAGHITVTPGNEADYDFIQDMISQGIAPRCNITALAVDRLFQGAQLCQGLIKEGYDVMEWGQGFMSMAAPTKEFVTLVGRGAFHHGDNPLVTYQARNLQGRMDAAGNWKPDKQRSDNKIDGITAAITGLGMAMLDEPEPPNPYDVHGVVYV